MRKLVNVFFGSRPQILPGVREDLSTASVAELVERSRSPDGFIREATLVFAAELRSPALLDAILDRLNDWVPQVRQAARIALLALVPLLPAPALLKSLPAIERLRLARRENHAAWIDEYHASVVDALGAEALSAEAVRGSGKIARACFDIVTARSLLDPGVLAERVLVHGADVVTSLAAWRVGAHLEASQRASLADIGLVSPFGAVRTGALRELLRSAGERSDTLAVEALRDPQNSVREVAMWYLKERAYPVARFYAACLEEKGVTMRLARICLVSLAACGNQDHVVLIRRFAEIPHARTQAVAVMAWARLAPDARDDILRFSLMSPFTRVRKLALVLMDDFGAYIDLAEGMSLAEKKSDYALVLSLARREPWTWLTTILTMAKRPDEAVPRTHLLRELHMWRARSASIYTKPTTEQVRILLAPDTRQALTNLAGRDIVRTDGAFRQLFILHGLEQAGESTASDDI